MYPNWEKILILSVALSLRPSRYTRHSRYSRPTQIRWQSASQFPILVPSKNQKPGSTACPLTFGPTLAQYGGKFVARGGKIDVLEGSWNPKRIVILEFESAARARQWYDSEEYRVPKQIRMRASKGNIIVVEGV